MYKCGNKNFEDIFQAIDYCKLDSKRSVEDEDGKVLMTHEKVSFEDFRDILLAKNILEIQKFKMNKSWVEN